MPYSDDVLKVAESADQLEVKLRSVLKRFKEDGLRLRADKCEFFVCQVKFLGFLITEDGISPTNEKIKAIQEAPAPTSKLELQAFLGMLNFFHLFLENKATVAEPLHKLLHKGISWKWTTEEQDAFDKLKRMLSSSKNLAHYDEKKALVLTCDASPYGVGAVLSHLDECAFIQKSLGPVSYRLYTPEGNVLHRHVDQIRRRQEEIDSSPILSDTSNSPRIGNEKQLLDTVDKNEGQRDANVQVDVSEPISGGQVIQNRPVVLLDHETRSIFKGLYKLIFYEVEGRSVMYETVVLPCSSLE
ncbi:hypothetical protein JTB14_001461 [Gonioctena quinquepunctata]|nr:hypothetical protein JTB14_001461 [Gonioctena quinquepunctata]